MEANNGPEKGKKRKAHAERKVQGEEEEEEEEVITLRFVDRKYRVPGSALEKIAFFKGFLGKGVMRGSLRLADGSYFIPELAGPVSSCTARDDLIQ